MKKMISIVLSMLLCIMAVPLNFVSFAADQTDDNFFGSGTESDPFQIRNATELALLAEVINDELVDGSYAKYRNAYFIQTADIDLKNRAWTPIGAFIESDGNTNKHYFAGHYNGNYHTIKNLNCANASNYAGLFGRLGENGKDYTDICVISNLSVYGNVSSDGYAVGGIAGEVCTGATIKNCSFTGNVSGKTDVGGIAGMTYNGGFIQNCYHNGTVSASNAFAGGVIGSLRVGNYEFSENAGVYNSYHTGGLVSATNGNVGGIVGRQEKGEKNTGCVIELTNNYYLSSTCDGGYNGESTSGYQKLSEEMWSSAVELLGSPYVSDTDNINGGYPVFEWQTTPYQFKGSGTADDPYQISSKAELATMRDLINSEYSSSKYNSCYYIQTADIDLQYENWTPIGIRLVDGKEAGRSFYGSYNGQNHVIKNLFVVRDVKFAGLFGSMNGSGAIENLVVYGEVNSTDASAGGVLGEICNGGGTVRNCAFIGDVTGNGYGIGGVVGYLWMNGTIEGCYHNGNVINNAKRSVGGVVGHISVGKYNDTDTTVKNCYHVGTVNGVDGQTGTLVGLVEEFTETAGKAYITNCFAVKGEAGTTYNGSVTKCEISELTSNMMKFAYADLGEPFVKANSDDINGGYPVFSWQQPDYLMGDVNNDGAFNVTDIVLLQKWLLAVPNTHLENWRAINFCNDERLDVFDLCLAKRALIYSGNIEGVPKSITLNKTEATLEIEGSGSSLQLTASILPDDVKDKSVTWTSSNNKVATVSSTGLVTAVGSGTAFITARTNLGGKTATCKVIVVDPSISISPASASVLIGGTTTITAKAVPSGAAVSWKSDNTAVATVSGGSVKGVKEGTANITASITINGKTYTSGKCVITVTKGGITLSKSSVSLYTAGNETITATTNPKNQSVTWSTSDSKIATVSGGKITAVAAGTATITAKTTIYGVEYSASCNVTVTQPSIKLDKTSSTIYLAGTDKITATVVAPNGTSVAWSTSDAKIATVSGGTVTAVASGTATITAKISVNGKDYTATCKTTVVTPSIKFDKTSGTQYIAGTDKITATVVPSTASVSWSTSDSKIATVNGGTVTFVAKGTATITGKISVSGKTYTATYTATCKQPSISLSKSSHTMWIGDTVTLTATTDPSGRAITWSSSNTGVASVSSGKVTGVGEGTATITGTMDVNGKKYSASCSITLKKPYLTLGTVNYSQKDDHVYYSSSTGGFYAGIFDLPSAACTPSGSASWSVASGNASINGGKVLINQPGTVVVRASFSYGGKTYTADYTYTRSVTFYAGSAFTLRSGPSTSTSSLGSIPKGTSLTVASLDYSDSKYVWGKVTYNGKTGYVALWLKNRSESNGIITV